jgi:glycerophosphoryl diester phosphodiesterase
VTPSARPATGGRAPLCIAHRGASASAPENTLAAFTRAFDEGADWIECDVRLTADGAPVVLHDATLDRTTDGRGPVARRSLADVRRLDAGSWFAQRFRGERVPTLAETLECARGRGGVNVELKCEGNAGRVRETHRALARAVADAIARSRFPGPLVVSSFSRPALAAGRAAMPRARLGFLVSRTTRGTRSLHRSLGLWSLHPHVRLATPARFAAARRLGLVLLAWGVDDPEDARRLRALGADGLMADDPARLRARLDESPLL